ncbi:MAG: HAMP domain-containing sensor histidine kinase [Pseudomonadota bacterium]
MSENRVPHSRPKGITDRLLRVILLQLLFISAITALGVFVSAKVVEGVMMRAALEGEANHFWDLYATNRDQALPNTDNLIGFLAQNGTFESVPEGLRALEPGFGRASLAGRNPVVMVQERGRDRLYLVFDEESVSRLSFYFGVVPLSLALMVIYISAWFAFRQTRKAVSPVARLANLMRDLDIESKSLDRLDVSNLGMGSQDEEVNILVDALDGFIGRITKMVENERLFTRDASHELRTPLTVVQGSAEWLLTQPGLDERQHEVVERVLRTSRDMSELIHALLVLARGETGQMELELLNVNRLADTLCQDIGRTHNADGHVSVTVRHPEECSFRTSPQILKIVFANLVRNAFNYTYKGHVTVCIRNKQMSVTNIGEGVNPKNVDRFFEPFYRGDSSGDSSSEIQNVKGYGVGLDIVKRLCDLMNWSIHVDFQEDIGMRFTVDMTEQALIGERDL